MIGRTSEVDSTGLTIRRLVTPDEIAASQSLRFRIWSDQDGVQLRDKDSGHIADDHDDYADHWGAFDGEELIGSARMCVHNKIEDAPDGHLFAELSIATPVASINRLVVRRAYRGQGLAARLDEIRVEAARSNGVNAVIVAPLKGQRRIRHLQSVGFELIGADGIAEWSDATIVAMILRL